MIIQCYFDIRKGENRYRIEKDGKTLHSDIRTKQEALDIIAEMQQNNVFDIRTRKRLPSVVTGNRIILLDPNFLFNNLRDMFVDCKQGHKVDRMKLRYLLTSWSKIKNQTTLTITEDALNTLYDAIKVKK